MEFLSRRQHKFLSPFLQFLCLASRLVVTVVDTFADSLRLAFRLLYGTLGLAANSAGKFVKGFHEFVEVGSYILHQRLDFVV
jgi:hypothetical protein